MQKSTKKTAKPTMSKNASIQGGIHSIPEKATSRIRRQRTNGAAGSHTKKVYTTYFGTERARR